MTEDERELIFELATALSGALVVNESMQSRGVLIRSG
jgi:hypothetical protein